MALPDDVTTVTITFGPYLDAKGNPSITDAEATLKPVDPVTGKPIRVVHMATGVTVVPAAIPIAILGDGTASVGPIPHTDNPSLSPVGFAYAVEWKLSSNAPSPGNKTIAVPASSGPTVDFDVLLAASQVPGVLLAPAVTSVNGKTGAVALTASDVGADAAGAATAAQAAATLYASTGLAGKQDAGDYATNTALTSGLAGKVNSSTYTAGLAGKQDAATLAADTAAHVSDGSALDTALRAASVAAVEDADTVAPAGAWDFATAPTVNGSPVGATPPDASTTTKGIVELATTAETTTGTDTTRAVSPAGVKAAIDALHLLVSDVRPTDPAIGLIRIGKPYVAPTLLDNFATQDTGKWTGWSANVTATGGQLRVIPSASYDNIRSSDTYDLTAASVYIELVSRQGMTNTSAQTSFGVQTTDGSNSAAFFIDANLTFRSHVTTDSDTSVSYDAVAHRWLRVGGAGGNLVWSTSPDGVAWTERRSVAVPFSLAAVQIKIGGGYWDSGQSAPTAAVFDNLYRTAAA